MYTKPSRPSLKNVIKKTLAALGIVIGVAVIVAVAYFGVRYWMNRPSSTPAPVVESIPPSESPNVNHQPPGAPTCYKWDLVARENVGQFLCVYGTIVEIYSTREASTRIKFSDAPNTFFIYSADQYFFDAATGKDLKAGDCVSVNAVVQLIGGVLNMEIDRDTALYFCEDWMK